MALGNAASTKSLFNITLMNFLNGGVLANLTIGNNCLLGYLKKLVFNLFEFLCFFKVLFSSLVQLTIGLPSSQSISELFHVTHRVKQQSKYKDLHGE